MKEIIAKIPLVAMHQFGESSFLFIRRYKPSTVILTKDQLIIKFLGFLKVRDIPIQKIKKVELIQKRLVKKGLIAVYMDYALSVLYGDDRTKTIYLIAQEEKLKPLKEFFKI